MDPDQRELELRAHVRYLLFDYARAHLTKDYLTFSEDAVSELLSGCLCIVPTTDPLSLTLPEDSFQTLSRTLGLPDLKPWDEKWPADRDGIQLLREFLTFSGKPRAERCWADEDEFNYDSWIYRPMSPILTTRAIRETPKLGSGVALKSIPTSQDDVLKSFERVDPELIEEPPRAKLEDALNLRLAIDSKTHSSMVSLFKSVPQMFPSKLPYVNSHVASFLHSDSSLPALPQPEFVPMFARAGRPGGAHDFDTFKFEHPSIPSALPDLPTMLPELAVVENEDNDLYKQHMTIIDGWQTLAPSSPSSIGTPSLASGTSEIDELFLMSPPGSQPILIRELMASRIETTEMPRIKTIGGATQKPELVGDGQSFGSFLSPFVSGNLAINRDSSNPRIVTTPRSSPRSSISLSILGQPSSLLETIRPSELTRMDAGGEDQQMDFDAVVSKLYAEVREHDPANLILKERLDDKGGMLMDVPNMPQPNIHPPTAMYLPTTMDALLHFSAKSKFGDEPHGFFKKVTGLKSLNMELSWKPFHRIPTDEEVARVDGEIEVTEVGQFGDIENAKLSALLEQATVSSDAFDIFRGWDNFDKNIKQVGPAHVERFGIMLTREERRRLSRTSDNSEDDQAESLLALDHPGGKSSYGEAGLREISADGSAKNPSCDWNVVPLDDADVSFAHPSGAIDHKSSNQDQFFRETNLPQDANKENVPFLPDHPMSQQIFGTESNDQDSFPFGAPDEDVGNGTFIPLSFDSNRSHSSHASQQHNSDQRITHDTSARRNTYLDEFPADERNPPRHSLTGDTPVGQTSEVVDVVQHSNLSHQYSESTPDALLTSATFDARSLDDFLAWRNVSVNQDSFNAPEIPQTAKVAPENVPNGGPSEAHVIPEDIFDRNTLCLPSPWLQPPTTHRYLASVDLVQKRSIVRSLGLLECAVELVERNTLGGVDLILDPHTAIIFASLMALPSQCEALTAKLSCQSWRYSRVLVIFEAFPSSLAYQSNQAPTRLAPNPYTPPILRAIKKLRRDLGIAEALDTKNVSSSINFAFASNVREAALITRCFGNCAEANDTTGGAIWGLREWLDVDEQEGEQDLASMDGMNAFAASVILCQETLQDFLDLAAEARALKFGYLVGQERVTLFNGILGRRYQAVISSSPSYLQASDDNLVI